MNNSIPLSAAERSYGLSLIWQEANYNFAFFDRVPDLDWDAAVVNPENWTEFRAL
jgi:carboxyl-terminal processing protease